MKYEDTESSMKQKINKTVANSHNTDGIVVCLDGKNMRTTKAYIDAGIHPRDIMVVERDLETINEMRIKDIIPPGNITHGDITKISSFRDVRGIYYDSMGNNSTVKGVERICNTLSKERVEKKRGRKQNSLNLAVTMSKRVKPWPKGSRPVGLKGTGARKNTALNRIKDIESIMKYYSLEFKQTNLIESYRKDKNSQQMCWVMYDIKW